MWTDRVCLYYDMNLQNGVNCVNEFGFFVIEEQSGGFNENGVLGLGPYSGSGPNFVKALKDQGTIPEAIVSWSLTSVWNNTVYPSSINFGAINSSDYLGDTKALESVSSATSNWVVSYQGSIYSTSDSSDDEFEKDDFTDTTATSAIVSSADNNIMITKSEW